MNNILNSSRIKKFLTIKLLINFYSTEKVILFIRILYIILSFISEIYFHYIQEFRPESTDSDIFWRMEAAKIFNAIVFLIKVILYSNCL